MNINNKIVKIQRHFAKVACMPVVLCLFFANSRSHSTTIQLL